MARSVKAMAGTALILSSTALAACDSTPTQSARVKLIATREIASREPQAVAADNPQVEVKLTALVGAGKASAGVVELASSAQTPLTDLPIEFGVRRGKKTLLWTAGPNLGWFQTHVAAIGARGTATWVIESPKGIEVEPGDEPFARVGQPATGTAPVVSSATELPALRVTGQPGSTPRRAQVLLANNSEVPQAGVQVVATARDGERYVAAGVATVPALGRGRTQAVSIPLTGRATSGAIRVVATPTIFQ